MPIISQNLPIPQGLVDGAIADANQVLPLYNALNALNIPGTIGVFQQALVSNSNTAINMAGTQFQDYTVPSVPAAKSILFYIPFGWVTISAVTLTIQLRVNAAAATAATANIASAATGNGILLGFIPGHDGTGGNIPRSHFAYVMNDGNLNITVAEPNVDLPSSATVSVGIAFGGATSGTVNVKYVRIWQEG